MECELISFPASGTYDVITATSVHAHPAKRRGYPKNLPRYLAFRQKGGIITEVYQVMLTIDESPDQAQLDPRLAPYVKARRITFGFTPGIEYRFYILQRIYDVNPPYVQIPNLRSYKYMKLQEVI